MCIYKHIMYTLMLSLSLSLYIYIYIHINQGHIYIYIYIYQGPIVNRHGCSRGCRTLDQS